MRFCQAVTPGKITVGIGLQGSDVGWRIGEHLKHQRGTTSIFCHKTHNCSKIASCTYPANSNTGRVSLKTFCIFCCPLCGTVSVFNRSGKFMCWCQPVIHGNHNTTNCACKISANVIALIKRTKDPSTTVQVNEQGKSDQLLQVCICVGAVGLQARQWLYLPPG